MSLMELIVKVLQIKKRDLTALLLNSLFIILFYFLLFENSEIIYPLILSGTIILVYFIIETVKYKSFLQKLEESKTSPDYNNSKVDFKEEAVLNIIKEIHNDYLNKIYTLNQKIKTKDTLFSQWIHNMKTSITVIDLACEKSILSKKNNEYIDDIKEENISLKKNLEECLNLLRLEDFSRDYITDPCNLRELVNTAVNSKKRDFIYKSVFPKVNIAENINVYTDKKWCHYMIEQILSNSIKYSNAGSKIDISAVDNSSKIELIIKDNGIGILEEDLPRVFDPFFTGSNGRNERSSTGIGLYMVKVISKKLGHAVEIESTPLSGTQFKIIFKNQEIFQK